ncbi:MAG: amidohydrolase family protein, partial [Actinomycetota bacterium]
MTTVSPRSSSDGGRTTIFTADRIITMNPANPSGEAVAVRDGRVLGVGPVDQLRGWGPAEVDRSFEGKVLLPGFVEAHCHAGTGAVWTNPYVGFFPRRAPDGVVWDGCPDVDSVIDRLRRIDQQMRDAGAPEDELIYAWGLDPLYFEGAGDGNARMSAADLDRASLTRPIYVHHVSGHLATVNTALLEREDITADATTPGVARRADGHPNGELQEPAAMQLATEAFARAMAMRDTAEGLWNFGYEARNAGHTTVIDLASGPLDDDSNRLWSSVVEDPAFPARVMRASSLPRHQAADAVDLAAVAAGLRSTDKLRYGVVKLFLDGSIQGFTARVSWPFYFDPPPDSHENGIWLTTPDQMADIVEPFHRAGLTVHCHCNGDQATEVFLDAIETVLERHPRWDHRNTVQHCQMTTPAQYRRMAALGMCANIFSNHIFYWGDLHRERTIGPERAAGMDAAANALAEGVS